MDTIDSLEQNLPPNYRPLGMNFRFIYDAALQRTYAAEWSDRLGNLVDEHYRENGLVAHDRMPKLSDGTQYRQNEALAATIAGESSDQLQEYMKEALEEAKKLGLPQETTRLHIGYFRDAGSADGRRMANTAIQDWHRKNRRGAPTIKLTRRGSNSGENDFISDEEPERPGNRFTKNSIDTTTANRLFMRAAELAYYEAASATEELSVDNSMALERLVQTAHEALDREQRIATAVTERDINFWINLGAERGKEQYDRYLRKLDQQNQHYSSFAERAERYFHLVVTPLLHENDGYSRTSKTGRW